MDFYEILVKDKNSNNKKSDCSVEPEFLHKPTKDLICKGGVMYAFWNEDHWDRNIHNLIIKIDKEIWAKHKEIKEKNPSINITTKTMIANSSGKRKEFDTYTKYEEMQSDIPFNTKIIFSDDKPKREDYSTHQLNYYPSKGSTENFDTLIDRLYSPEEKLKIMWFMGALLTNSMSDIQKFMFLYGGKGTGKGTVLKIFKDIFEGYYAPINLRILCGGGDFATAKVEELPLLIDDDCDLSGIVDDTNLLKLTSHEPLLKNEKFLKAYDVSFPGLLICASNQRFKVRNVDSGITRRAIVVEPSTYTFDGKTYRSLMKKIKFEIPHIAYEAIKVFKNLGSTYYDDYVDTNMLQAGDIMYEFVCEYYEQLGDCVTLKRAAELYKTYLDELGYDSKGYKRKVKNELQRYYRKFVVQKKTNGGNVKNVFEGLKTELIFPDKARNQTEEKEETWIELTDHANSIMEKDILDCPAQYTNEKGEPRYAWDNCRTVLKSINTMELHFVRVPLNHIVIDFDLKGEDGEKSLELNIEQASKFPPTYCEVSKSGRGLHLHYIYDGDVSKLSNKYDKDIEIKVFTGKSSLRRKLTKCNDLHVAHISSGLPIKEGKKVFKNQNDFVYTDENIHTMIRKCLSKHEYHNNTAPNMNYIHYICKQAEANGVEYDITDLFQDIHDFANLSHNQAAHCIRLANDINYCTINKKEFEEKVLNNNEIIPDENLVFFDIEVFPNMWMVCWKQYKIPKVHVMINPKPEEIEELMRKPLVGFNNRGYDNHILYGGWLGKKPIELYYQSKAIIDKEKDSREGYIGQAYSISYADILDYSATIHSLKKWEIEMGITHDELEFKFDEPLPESEWNRCAEYCCHDVEATEALFDYIKSDYMARVCLSVLSGKSVNEPTRKHAEVILFEGDEYANEKFNYVNLAEEFPGYEFDQFGIDVNKFRFPTPEEAIVIKKPNGNVERPIPVDDAEGKTRKTLFKGSKSIYRGDAVSEGGYVYSEPGIYYNVALLDVASLHPSSIIAMNYFGPYTKNFADIRQTRIYIKHAANAYKDGNMDEVEKQLSEAKKLFNGKLAPYLNDIEKAKDLSYALKIVINRIYGYTVAKFDNPFKHKANIDNIVAKRGALFMIELKHQVQAMGYRVAHIKTDSIKIPNADEKIINFITEFGKKYGYDFELEHIYKRMCLINKSTYIAQLEDGSWSATGAEFAQPYIFKTLFSGEDFELSDFLETKEVKDPARIYLGDKFIGKNAEVYVSQTGEELFRIAEGKSGAIPGTKGWLWKMGSELKDIRDVEMNYYESLRDKAIKSINLVGASSQIIDMHGTFDNLITYY